MKSSVMFLIPVDKNPLMLPPLSPIYLPYCGNFVHRCSSNKLSRGFFWSSSINSLILAFRRYIRKCLSSLIKLCHQVLPLMIADKFLHFPIGGKFSEFVLLRYVPYYGALQSIKPLDAPPSPMPYDALYSSRRKCLGGGVNET